MDIGGTSTDVSRYSGRYEITYETTTAGISIQSPQLNINTVAAGGGSCLTFSNGLFKAGPESAGAHPGPACYRLALCIPVGIENSTPDYRKGGPLALTDANLLLGRIIPDYFPKIFGNSKKEPLDIDVSKQKFETLLREEIKSALTLDEAVYGYVGLYLPQKASHYLYRFIKVANETICRPIR